MTYHILFVCLGNICRSPLAEAVFKRKAEEAGLGSRFMVDSAGLIDYHEGELADPRMRDHAGRRGYRLTHRSRPIRPADYQRFDLIVGMDEANLKALRRLAPSREARDKVHGIADYFRQFRGQATVPDPYYGGPDDFELAIDLIEDACEGLIEQLRREVNWE